VVRFDGREDEDEAWQPTAVLDWTFTLPLTSLAGHYMANPSSDTTSKLTTPARRELFLWPTVQSNANLAGQHLGHSNQLTHCTNAMSCPLKVTNPEMPGYPNTLPPLRR